jgi:hypothetical protein
MCAISAGTLAGAVMGVLWDHRIFALGAYVGEAFRRRLGGDWMADDDDPAGEVNVILRLPDGTVIWPVQRVLKRPTNGPRTESPSTARLSASPQRG